MLVPPTAKSWPLTIKVFVSFSRLSIQALAGPAGHCTSFPELFNCLRSLIYSSFFSASWKCQQLLDCIRNVITLNPQRLSLYRLKVQETIGDVCANIRFGMRASNGCFSFISRLYLPRVMSAQSMFVEVQ